MSPSKKQKLTHSDTDGTDYAYNAVLSDVKAEIDLEIAMRLRLTETLASRIAWAESLRDAIRNGNGSISSENFRTTALNTLSMLEAPTRFITDPEPVPPPSANPPPFVRPLPRKPTLPAHQVQFLYTRGSLLDNEGNPNQLYILKCPMCERTTFTKLQGLLNHARLRHAHEWGTHDECIRACAVPDDSIDISLGAEVGISLPGLRTLFRNAVDSRAISQMNFRESLTQMTDENTLERTDSGTHLNETLGLHADTPSLAPYLGKDVIRREIKVWDTELPVDIEHDVASKRAVPQRRWRMLFGQRNAGDSVLSHLNEPPTNQVDESKGSYPRMDAISAENSQSVVSGEGRFHFSARIVITDRSMSLQPGVNDAYTHKWMISVDSPSYSHPISSILHSVKVSPSNPGISVPAPPETTKPPFVVVGLADKPFLARVELYFAGSSSSSAERPYQKMVFEHWVDLDPLKLGTVVIGQDQVLDVELDKNTVLQPFQTGYTPIESKSLWVLPSDPVVKQLSGPQSAQTTQPDTLPAPTPITDDTSSGTDLKFSLLSQIGDRFPLFRSDTSYKLNQTSDPPYTLVSSLAEFSTLLPGRRKAIEWRRLRAIRDAFNEQKPPTLAVISATEVYDWLSDNGRLPATESKAGSGALKQEDDQDASRWYLWCNICGLHSSVHPKQSVANDRTSSESPDTKPVLSRLHSASILSKTDECGIVPQAPQVAKLPRTDVQTFVSNDKRHPNAIFKITPAECHSLVSATDPQLLLAILQTANQLDLPSTLPHPATPSESAFLAPSYPLQTFGEDHSEVEHNLAPYAIMAMATRAFIRQLIDRGLEVANRDQVLSTGAAQNGNRSRSRQEHPTASHRLLTPTHVLSGILTRGRERGAAQDAVVLSCLSKLGVAAEPRPVAPSCQGQQEVHVKMEEE